MSQLGRLLVLTAQYYAYTGDASLLLRHEAKLAGIAQLLRGRRQSALAAFPAGTVTISFLRLGRRFLSVTDTNVCADR